MTESNNALATTLILPYSNVTLPNRLCKAAMTEHLADPLTNYPNKKHLTLYTIWSAGGTGTLITGNVMVDRRYMENPRNCAIEQIDVTNTTALEQWKQYAAACKSHGSIAIVQLSHGGRQTPRSVNNESLAPSAIPIMLKGLPAGRSSPFMTPREATLSDIQEVIQRFVTASEMCYKAGFDGVQVHAAHGYLISSFLSPNSNLRTDAYGGSAEKRCKLLIEIITAIRKKLPSKFIVSVKLNSADFQQGGFTEHESINVSKILDTLNVDFVEYSGGTYESAAMMSGNNPYDEVQHDELLTKNNSGAPLKQSTKQREAYFIQYIEKVRTELNNTKMKIMLTGGWRSAKAMHNAIHNQSVDIIGLARPLCIEPDFSTRLLSYDSDVMNKDVTAIPYTVEVQNSLIPAHTRQTLNGGLQSAWHTSQIIRLANNLPADLNLSVWPCLTTDFVTAMYWDSQKYPRLSTGLYLAYLFTLIGLAAVGWKALFSYYGMM